MERCPNDCRDGISINLGQTILTMMEMRWGSPINVIFTRYYILAKARLKDRGAKGEWTKFDEEFVYYREPKSGEELKFSIVMTSSVNGDSYSGAVGSRLVVDDVEVVLR